MLSKCANPNCEVPFRYFHTGKLFRVDISTGRDRRRAMGEDSEQRKPLRRLEFYWLCQECAGKMTLVYEKELGIKVRSEDLVHSAAA
jgi:hypothetical protein